MCKQRVCRSSGDVLTSPSRCGISNRDQCLALVLGGVATGTNASPDPFPKPHFLLVLVLPPYPWFWHIQAVAKAGRRCHNFVASWQVVSEVFIVIALNLLYRLWNYGWMPNGSTYLEMIPLTVVAEQQGWLDNRLVSFHYTGSSR